MKRLHSIHRWIANIPCFKSLQPVVFDIVPAFAGYLAKAFACVQMALE